MEQLPDDLYGIPSLGDGEYQGVNRYSGGTAPLGGFLVEEPLISLIKYAANNPAMSISANAPVVLQITEQYPDEAYYLAEVSNLEAYAQLLIIHDMLQYVGYNAAGKWYRIMEKGRGLYESILEWNSEGINGH